MNKEKFLEVLKARISILEDEEQTDILEEYAQHIDMEIAEGASEEEAVAKFGNVNELAAEILSAYHVKANFDDENTNEGLTLDSLKDAGSKLVKDLASFRHTATPEEKESAAAMRQERRKKAKADRRQRAAERAEAKAEWKAANPDGGAAAKAVKAAGRGARSTGIEIARWLCILCVVAVLVCVGSAAIATLFSFGVSLVLLCQGLPLIGVTLSFLGVSAITVVLVVLLARLIKAVFAWKKEAKANA